MEEKVKNGDSSREPGTVEDMKALIETLPEYLYRSLGIDRKELELR